MKEAEKLLAELEAAFAKRTGRDGTLNYLVRVYAVVRKNRKSNPNFLKAVKNRLLRKPQTSSLFAHVIEATSTYASGDRSKYVKILRIADKKNIHSTDFKSFVQKAGGFNAVTHGGGTSSSVVLSFAGQKRQIERKVLEEALDGGEAVIRIRCKLNGEGGFRLIGNPKVSAKLPRAPNLIKSTNLPKQKAMTESPVRDPWA